MAKIRLTLNGVQISDSSISFYSDVFENFKKDCVALGVAPFTQFEEIVFCDDVNYYKSYIIYNGNQMPLTLEIEDFCKICFSKKLEFQKLKQNREQEPEIPFATKKANAVQEITAVCANARLKISGTTDTNKTASWAVYRDLANRFKSNLLTDVEKTCLETEIFLRQVEGETLVSFVDKILQNSELFLKATTTITGAEKRANLDIDQAQNKENLAAAIQKLKDTLKVLE